jgi:hypothetical protein
MSLSVKKGSTDFESPHVLPAHPASIPVWPLDSITRILGAETTIELKDGEQERTRQGLACETHRKESWVLHHHKW